MLNESDMNSKYYFIFTYQNGFKEKNKENLI